MANTPVYLEVGKSKVFACAADWPGWARSGKTAEAALEALAGYATRYAEIASRAKARFAANAGVDLEVVEEVPGSATTDFGAIGAIARLDTVPMSRAQAQRWTGLLEACWACFDDVVADAPAALRKGPRGGGRDRDQIVAHVVESEQVYARKAGLPKPSSYPNTAALRADIVATLGRASDGSAPIEKGWPARYAIRRMAWHVLDHAWEIQDRST